MRSVCLLLLVLSAAVLAAQDQAPAPARGRGQGRGAARGAAPAQPPQPQVFPPSAEQKTQIDAKLADLTTRINALVAKKTDPQLLADVQIYQKAAQYILRFPEEFFGANYAAETIAGLDTGLARAKELEAGTSSWTKKTGHVVRGYVSRVDGSVQPYGMTIPASYDGSKPIRLDIWLHGTATNLNEVRFIAQQSADHSTSQIQMEDYIQMEPLGRMNHSYRYAGETDVFEAIASVQQRYKIDPKQILVRGHSMGGQAWHLGLQHPGFFTALEASAGYVDTHEYAANRLPKEGLPPYQETTLHYYDSQDYAVNAYDIISVGYGGEQDAQLRASVKIREALLKEGFKFTQESPFKWTTKDFPALLFLVGPKTGHAWEPNSKIESEAFLRKAIADAGGKPQDHLRCVTYTTRWDQCDWLTFEALDQTYQRADAEAVKSPDGKQYTVTTKGVARIKFDVPAATFVIDGQTIKASANPSFEKANGKWAVATGRPAGLRKIHGLQGPIDDAFHEGFLEVRGTGQPWNAAVQAYAQKRHEMSKGDFAKWMRGDVRVKDDTAVSASDIANYNLVLFGDPGSNSLIAKVMGKLPIQWTKSEITVGSQKFSAADNALVMIYPNPLNPQKYVVINSGHTYNADRNAAGSESMFFPRVGDYAVISTDQAAMVGLTPIGTIKMSGFFDESWKLK